VGQFNLALNDEPGDWTIRATDFVSRKAGAATVTVSR
jgi:hypothetical protein